MAKNSNNKWTPEEDSQLREGLQSNLTVHLIAAKLRRTPQAVMARAQALKRFDQADKHQVEGKETKSESTVFIIGSRVRLSALGATRCPRMINKIGTVVRTRAGRYTSIDVVFDGNKTVTPLHRDYIELS